MLEDMNVERSLYISRVTLGTPLMYDVIATGSISDHLGSLLRTSPGGT